MIRIIRTLAIENPWCLRIIMGVIALVFVVTMGWWGFEREPGAGVVATVGDQRITLRELQDAHEQVLRFLRERWGDALTEKRLDELNPRAMALDSLIEKKLLLQAARDHGIWVTDEELRRHVRAFPVFQREGRFDPKTYTAFLKANRLTPEQFETEQREFLAIEKLKARVRDAVVVTEEEVRQSYRKRLGKAPFREKDFQEERALLTQILLLEKQEKAMRSYLDFLRRTTPVRIKSEYRS